MLNENYSRWTMCKNLFFFQVKLAFDALRDLVLSPISFICTLVDIIKKNDNEQSQFNQLMRVGKRTDIWLNLFNQHPIEHVSDSNETHDVLPDSFEITDSNTNNNSHESVNKTEMNEQNIPQSNIDQLLIKIERLVKEQQHNGDLTMTAKTKITQYLSRIKKENQSQENL